MGSIRVFSFLLFATLLRLGGGSPVSESFDEIVLAREKRAVDTNKAGFTAAEKKVILDKHNEFRRVPNAANMELMEWDDELEKVAQNWVNQCKYEDNSARSVPSTGDIPGESSIYSKDSYTPEYAPSVWNSQVKKYNYSKNACSAMCYHYTQIVWAVTYKVGCGIKYCGSPKNLLFAAYIIVCNYIKAGNTKGEKPYVEGAACSQCPTGKTTCNNGLCSKDSPPTVTTGGPDNTTCSSPGLATSTTTAMVFLTSLWACVIQY